MSLWMRTSSRFFTVSVLPIVNVASSGAPSGNSRPVYCSTTACHAAPVR
jgi:hypothetical protein